jgi:hypothetical protein
VAGPLRFLAEHDWALDLPLRPWEGRGRTRSMFFASWFSSNCPPIRLTLFIANLNRFVGLANNDRGTDDSGGPPLDDLPETCHGKRATFKGGP